MKLTHLSFKTDRLLITPLSENDSGFIMELVNTEGWIRFIGNRNIGSATDAIAYIQKINNNENVQYWTVNLLETSSSIGIVTLIKRDYLEYNDIGFAFLPAFHNMGYAYEAVKTVLAGLFSQNLITEILAATLPENTKSIRLLKRLGLMFEKQFEIDNQTLELYIASKEDILNSTE